MDKNPNLNKKNFKALPHLKTPWDDRFHLGRMQPFFDQSSITSIFQSGSMKVGKSKQELEPITKPPTDPQLQPIISSLQDLQKAKEKLEHAWNLHKIPDPLRQVFRDAIYPLPRQKSIPIILKEVQNLRKNRSPLLTAIHAVAAREESLKSLLQMNSYLSRAENWETIQDVQVQCAQLMHAHRILSLNVVESIVKWREQIVSGILLNPEESKSKIIPFVWQGQNYLLKMKTDMDFLGGSEFAKTFSFCLNGDPFLVQPSKTKENIGKQKKTINYFVQNGQVIIPLPSILMKRIRIAEKILLEEEINERRAEANLEPIVLDQKKKKLRKRDLKAIELVANQMIETQIQQTVQEILQENFSSPEFISQVYLQNLINECVKQDFIEEIQTEFREMVVQDLFQGLFTGIQGQFVSIAEECIENPVLGEQVSLKAKELREFQISEMITSKLVQEIIEQVKLSQLAQSELKTAISQKSAQIQDQNQKKLLKERQISIQNQKIGKDLYQSLLNEFMEQIWVQDLAQHIYGSILHQTSKKIDQSQLEPQDYIMENFTPDIHSPVDYSLDNSPLLDQSDLFQSFGYRIGSQQDCSTIQNLMFVPARMPQSAFIQSLSDYLPFVPSIIKESSLGVQELSYECSHGVDTCWYWGINKQNLIVGALIYSVDYLSNTGRTLQIWHISCVGLKGFPEFINLALNFLWKIDRCDQIRANLYIPVIAEIPREIKKVYTQLKFRWKTERQSRGRAMKVVIMGITRPENVKSAAAFISSKPPFRVTSSNIIHIEEEKSQAEEILSQQLIEYGNRHCMVSALLGHFGQLDKGKIKLTSEMQNKHQVDLNNMIQYIGQHENFNFQCMQNRVSQNNQEINSFIKQNDLTLQTESLSIKSVSVFNFSCNWVSCTNLVHSLNNKSYHFLRFSSEQIQHFKDQFYQFFVVPTSQPLFSVFFVRSKDLKEDLLEYTRSREGDLYYRTSNIIASLPHADEPCSELWVPAFQFQFQQELPWVKGYKIQPQQEGDRISFVSGCQEQVLIEMNPSTPALGLFAFKPLRKYLLNSDFLFGVIPSQEKIPLFVSLIEKKNWLMA